MGNKLSSSYLEKLHELRYELKNNDPETVGVVLDQLIFALTQIEESRLERIAHK